MTDIENGGNITYEKISDKVAVDDKGNAVLPEDVLLQVEKKMQVIPEKHRKVIENTVKEIIKSNIPGACGYSPKTKQLMLDPETVSDSILHECGHILADAYGIYDDPEFIATLTEGLDLSSQGNLVPMYYKEQDIHIFVLENSKFVEPYQGRCYIKGDKIDIKKPIDAKMLQEYISVGYEKYFNDPIDLKKKDKKLFDYIERKMFK